jgi:hypothetical protein
MCAGRRSNRDIPEPVEAATPEAVPVEGAAAASGTGAPGAATGAPDTAASGAGAAGGGAEEVASGGAAAHRANEVERAGGGGRWTAEQ